jgi:demethoxyubiquinone hydroxylase (CLK1/Coq7/Cat5 family)
VNRRGIRLQALDRRLSDRDRRLVQEVVRLRFVTAGQLERLAFYAIQAPVTRARRTRRQLARLVELDLLWRLQRRVDRLRLRPDTRSPPAGRLATG